MLCLPFLAVCQQLYTCENAIEICSKGAFKIKYTRDRIEAIPDNKIDCWTEKIAHFWLTWTIEEAGDLSFTIFPKYLDDDIDFAVYKLDDKGGCGQKTLLRCMQSGMYIGDLAGSLRCLGPTGLTTAEKDTYIEDSGCPYGNNAFLSALQCQKGERYALAIHDFDKNLGNLSIAFYGSAMLSCDTVNCLELTTSIKYLPKKAIAVFPV